MSTDYHDSPPTPEELPHLLMEHVQYELHMFQFLAAAIPMAPSVDVSNALKESLLIHARCLMAFFNSRRVRDDVIASDYVRGWNRDSDGGAELQWLNENLEVYINKRVAHLTAYRLRVPKEEHFIADVQQRIAVLVERFNAKQLKK